MRIQIASDLHLEQLAERFPDFRGVEPAEADVLVLAGDIAQGAEAVAWFADWPCPVIYVPGNHEYYGSSLAATDAALSAAAAASPNVRVLHPGVCEQGGVRFIGCTLWTDYTLFGALHRDFVMTVCGERLPDHHVIRGDDGSPFTPEVACHLFQAQRSWLAAELARPFAGPTVVITHHAPSRGSLHPMYARSALSAAFIADLEALLGIADLHIHGHTHHAFDYHVGRTRVICNPLGYCRGARTVETLAELQRENPDFAPRCIVEL